MIFSKKILLLITFCFDAFFSFTQQKNKEPENNYRVEHWGIKDGLAQGEVNHMIKDINGFLWVSTRGGLSRFDGSLFKNYYFDPQKKGTISGTNIQGLIEDSLHNIWIGAENGLSRYDIKADTFFNFLPADAHTFDYNIVPFWATQNEVYCCEKDSIITIYDIHTFRKKTVAYLPKNISLYQEAYFVFDAKTNSVWMPEGDKTQGGLLQLSLFSSKAKKYTWQCFRKIPEHNHVSEGMCYDAKRYCLWISSNDGLLQFALSDKKFYYTDALNTLSNLKNYQKVFDLWHWVGIGMDKQNRIWIATVQKGIVIYNPADHSVKTPFANTDTLQREISDNNFCIYCDRDGMVWLGFWLRKGIYQLIPFTPAVTRYNYYPSKSNWLSSDWVTNIITGDKGTLWMGSDSGLNMFNPLTNTFKVLHEKELPGIKIIDNRIDPVVVDTTVQKAWLVSGNTIFEMNLITHKSKALTFKDIKGNNIDAVSINVVRPFNRGGITTGIYDNKEGIFVVNSDSNICQEVLSFPYHTINEWYTTSGDNHLIFLRRPEAMGNLTYKYSNNKCTRIFTPLDSLSWTKIFFNNEDFTYWVVAYRQLLHYDKNFQLIRRYTPENGLPDIEIYGIITDRRNNLWLNTDRFIHRLDLRTGQISMLSLKDGFQPQNFTPITTIAMDENGDLYFPGSLFGKGFDRINPYKYTYTSASVYIRSLNINQKPFPLSAGINNIQQLSLHYFENNITLETGNIDYYSEGTGSIRYKLENINATWQYAPANYTIRYEGLQPGNYKLIMQASNAANEFSGSAKVLFINISRAFWNTWWFRLFVIAIGSFVITSIFKSRIKKIRHDAFIKNQLKDLEMKALKAQMNPHFIYNALNSIQALVASDKKEEGIHYIGSFSRLLRQVLNNSENNVISLDKELETIDLYIQLETLRLNMQLQYKKIVPENIVTEFEKIPPLILQPFVENALWHGLSTKQGEKEIKISISIQDSWLLCDIIDNGIGRVKAQELKNNVAAFYQSKGIDITYKRLIDFNDDTVNPIEFFDLYDNTKNAAGTHVTIRIKRKSGLSSF